MAALRTAIKDEQRDVLGDIATSKLGLYQVSIAETAGAAIEAAFRVISKNPKLPQAVTLDEDPPLRLLPSLQLSHYFPARPEAGKVHILVTIAPGESRDPRPCGSHVTENVSPPALYPPTTTFLLPIPAPLLPHSTHSLSSTIDVDVDIVHMLHGSLRFTLQRRVVAGAHDIWLPSCCSRHKLWG